MRSPDGGAVAVVDAEGGGRLARLVVDGADVLSLAGCFVMAPWVGRTGWGRFVRDGVEHRLAIDMPPHAIHGTVRGVAWNVDHANGEAASLSAPLGPGWPWPGRCEQTLRLHDDGLVLSAAVHAVDGGASFPAALGWHPWFAKPVAVELSARAMLERGEDQLPTGRRVAPVVPGSGPLDDCFEGVDWPVVLRWPDGRRLDVEADGCDHVVVFDGRGDATCVEPQTAPPDALRSGATALVEPGQPLRAEMRLRWRHR